MAPEKRSRRVVEEDGDEEVVGVVQASSNFRQGSGVSCGVPGRRIFWEGEPYLT